MRALVVGGTGTVGRHVVTALLARGHDVRTFSRHAPIGGLGGTDARATGSSTDTPATGSSTDTSSTSSSTGAAARPDLTAALVILGDVSTGEGLAAALESVDVVVDCSNITTSNGKKAMAFFTESTARLREAEAAAGVGHHILLSVVGIDDIPYPYYQAKLAQERLATADLAAEDPATAASGPAPVAVTILRSTQFMEFGPQVATRTTLGPLVFVPDWPVQPVAAVDVARALADIAEAPPAGRSPDLGGPDILRLPDLVRSTLEARGTPERVVRIRVPGRAGRIMHSGGLLLDQGRIGSTTLAAFLAGLRGDADPGDAASSA